MISVSPSLRLSVSALLLCGALLLAGCNGAARLQPGGAYAPVTITATTTNAAPDYELFLADSTFRLAHAALDAAFTTERDNRALLSQVAPGVKPALDKIRDPAWAAVQRYALARAAYLAAPSPDALANLTALTGELQRLSAAATASLAARK